MNLTDLQPNDQVQITHDPKGTMLAEIVANESKSEFIYVLLLKPRGGVRGQWIKAPDETPLRKTAITNITTIP